MEFKEKLQILRTNMKLSQEELGIKLNISRQSVTKWENGRSFPNIQDLIQLSQIFNIPIDRLVKNNDACNININSKHPYPKQDIRMFLVRAKNSTYITGNHLILPSKPHSKSVSFVICAAFAINLGYTPYTYFGYGEIVVVLFLCSRSPYVLICFST